MSELPAGWRRVPLRELASISGGLTKGKQRRPGDRLVEVPYLRVANVQRGSLDLAEMKLIEATEAEVKQLQLLPGDVLFNEGGDRDKLGRGCVWNGELPVCIHQNHVFRARVGPDADPHYISMYGNSAEAQRYFLAGGKQTTNLASINLTTLGNLPVLLPPLADQRRIVKKVGTLRARSGRAREALDSIPSLLEKLRQSILAAAFRGDLTKDWRAKHPNVEPASELLKRIRGERRKKWEEAELAKMLAKGKPPKDDRWKAKYEEPKPVDATGLPELPEGWCWTTLDSLLDGGRGAAYGVLKPGPHVQDGVRFIKSGQVRQGFVDLAPDFRISVELDEEFRRTRLRGGEVLLNLVGASIGRSAVAPMSLEGANVTRAIAVLPVLADLATWVQLTLEGPEGQRLVRAATGGSAQPVLNLEEVRKLVVPLAPSVERLEVLRTVARLRHGQAAIEAAHLTASSWATSLERSVLSRAFRGELVLSTANEEPATRAPGTDVGSAAPRSAASSARIRSPADAAADGTTPGPGSKRGRRKAS